MKKLLSIILSLVLIFSIVGCSQAEKKSGVDKAKQLIREEEYDDAIKELEGILDEEEFNLEAWDLIADAYIKAEEYEKADEWLEQYLEMVDNNIEDKEFNSLKAIDSIGDYARDILRDGEFVSSWYENLVPEAINIDDLDYDYEMGTLLEFDVPSGTELYFSFEGSPKTDGTKYVDGILLDGEGYMTIDLVLVNKYGEYSGVTSAYFDVYDSSYVDDDTDNTTEDVELVLPIANIEPGTYTEFLELSFTNYNNDILENSDIEIRYTTNGSDPREYSDSIRYYYDSLPLTAGDYNIAVVAYDYNSDEFSEVAYFDYYIDHPDMVKLGLYMLPDSVVEAYKVMFDDAGWYDIFVAPIVYESLDLTSLDLNDLPDALITYGTYAEDLNAYGIVANIENYFDLADYDFIGEAADIGMFNGIKYMMPLTIRPEFMVYGDYEGAGLIDWEFIQGESEWYNNKFAFAADSPELFLGVYYGLGGAILDAEASNLDEAKVIEALTMIKSLSEAGIGTKLYTLDEVIEGFYEYNDEYFVMGDTIERDPSYYFSQVGQMPLSNGEYAKYYNVATGLFISNLSVTLDPTMQNKIANVYSYILDFSYYMSDIASSEGSLPANRYQAEDHEFYLDVTLDDYIAMIENGISSIRLSSLYTVYEALSMPLQEFVNGATPEEVAESIMINLSNSGN